MAARLGVRPSTFSEWKTLHAELAEAIKKWRDQFVAAGIDALEISAIARATGYMVTEAETVTEEGSWAPLPAPRPSCAYIPSQTRLYFLGRRIDLLDANDSGSASRIQGSTVTDTYGDELTTWPEAVFAMLISRLSVPGARFYGITNPDGQLTYSRSPTYTGPPS